MNDENARQPRRTVSVPVWVLVTLGIVVLGLTLIVGIGIGNPQGIAGIFASPTPTPTPIPPDPPLSADTIYQLINSSIQSGKPLYLPGANMPGADLTGADLTGANLSDAYLRAAKYNANTKWPVGFDPVAAGAVLVED